MFTGQEVQTMLFPGSDTRESEPKFIVFFKNHCMGVSKYLEILAEGDYRAQSVQTLEAS